ncbi:short-chain dehydrogenase [Hyaloraphidium curvatum]|nr:short-chain dehydrogenase [Hyaloraphidium curvatum]
MNFAGKLAAISGGGAGMGRELVLRLAKAGSRVAFCDFLPKNIGETLEIVGKEVPGAKVTGHRADVTKEEDWKRFRKETLEQHDSEHLDLLFNNAGIGIPTSMVTTPRDQFDKVFDVCYNGVYLGCRTFMGDLVKSPEARIVNTASANAFHAVLGIPPGWPHVSYSAAKFAVRGLTEALVVDLRTNAPNVKAHLVMPGHIGTKIGSHTSQVMGGDKVPDELMDGFVNKAATSPKQAAEIILKGVKEGRWRILVGPDAEFIDAKVRADPERAYEPEFMAEIAAAGMEVKV